LVDQALALDRLAAPLFAGKEVVRCGSGCDFSAVLAAVRDRAPAVIVMDFAPGGAEAIAAIEAVMAEKPTPILVLYRHGAPKEEVFRALDRGALDMVEWPEHPAPAFWAELAHRISVLAQVRVVQHVRGKSRKRISASLPAVRPPFPLVAIASSLGGPKALSLLLSMLPKAFPAPVLICQHISAGFTEGLARWLGAGAELPVVEAVDASPLRPGTVYVAPSGAHLKVGEGATVKLDYGLPLRGFKPSCDALLESAAEMFKQRAVGVILTGMGRDGALGLKEIRARGGRTVAQDEASCVVFGMPREAIALGAAEEVLPLEQIAAALVRLVKEC
jgi:two-component system chemotaxis response regulator CheB